MGIGARAGCGSEVGYCRRPMQQHGSLGAGVARWETLLPSSSEGLRAVGLHSWRCPGLPQPFRVHLSLLQVVFTWR